MIKKNIIEVTPIIILEVLVKISKTKVLLKPRILKPKKFWLISKRHTNKIVNLIKKRTGFSIKIKLLQRLNPKNKEWKTR